MLAGFPGKGEGAVRGKRGVVQSSAGEVAIQLVEYVVVGVNAVEAGPSLVCLTCHVGLVEFMQMVGSEDTVLTVLSVCVVALSSPVSGEFAPSVLSLRDKVEVTTNNAESVGGRGQRSGETFSKV